MFCGEIEENDTWGLVADRDVGLTHIIRFADRLKLRSAQQTL